MLLSVLAGAVVAQLERGREGAHGRRVRVLEACERFLGRAALSALAGVTLAELGGVH